MIWQKLILHRLFPRLNNHKVFIWTKDKSAFNTPVYLQLIAASKSSFIEANFFSLRQLDQDRRGKKRKVHQQCRHFYVLQLIYKPVDFKPVEIVYLALEMIKGRRASQIIKLVDY